MYLSWEWRTVFFRYASIWSGDPSDIEEERRLCYVGITRAMKELTLTCAKQRMIRGETQYNRVSRFVREVPRELVEDLGHTIQEKKPRVDDIVSPKSAYAQMKMNFQAKSTLQKKDFTVKKADSLDYGEGDTVLCEIRSRYRKKYRRRRQRLRSDGRL